MPLMITDNLHLKDFRAMVHAYAPNHFQAVGSSVRKRTPRIQNLGLCASTGARRWDIVDILGASSAPSGDDLTLH